MPNRIVNQRVVLTGSVGTLVFRGASTYDKGGSGDPWTDVTVPTGVQNGDIMIAVLAASTGTRVMTVPATWTQVTGSPVTSPGSDTVMYVLYRVAASEPASYTFDWDASAGGCACIVAYRGGDVLIPIDNQAAGNFASTATPTGPALTPRSGNCMVLAIYATDQAAGGVTWTPPNGYTERVDFQDAGGALVSIHVAEKLQINAATETPQATVSTADEGSAMTISLAPS